MPPEPRIKNPQTRSLVVTLLMLASLLLALAAAWLISGRRPIHVGDLTLQTPWRWSADPVQLKSEDISHIIRLRGASELMEAVHVIAFDPQRVQNLEDVRQVIAGDVTGSMLQIGPAAQSLASGPVRLQETRFTAFRRNATQRVDAFSLINVVTDGVRFWAIVITWTEEIENRHAIPMPALLPAMENLMNQLGDGLQVHAPDGSLGNPSAAPGSPRNRV